MTRSLLSAHLSRGAVFLIPFAVLACGEDGGNGDGGPAGTHGGEAGESGTDSGTSGGGAGGDGGEPQLASCLRELFAACPRAGSCTRGEQADTFAPLCFEDGTKSVRIPGTECQNSELQVYKADGSLCYTQKTQQHAAMACEQTSVTWRDGEGELVASRSVSYDGSRVREGFSCANGDAASACSTPGATPCTPVVWTEARTATPCEPGECAL